MIQGNTILTPEVSGHEDEVWCLGWDTTRNQSFGEASQGDPGSICCSKQICKSRACHCKGCAGGLVGRINYKLKELKHNYSPVATAKLMVG